MQVSVIAQSHFSEITFFDVDDSGDRAGRILDDRDNGAARRRIHDFLQRRLQQPIAIPSNEHAGE